MLDLPLRAPFFESQDLSLPMSPLRRFLFDQHLIPGEHQLFDLLHRQQPVDGCPLVLRLTGRRVKQVVVELLKPPERYGVRGNDLYKVAVHRTSSFVLSCQYNPATPASAGGNTLSFTKVLHWWSGPPACHVGSHADILQEPHISRNVATNGDIAGRRPARAP